MIYCVVPRPLEDELFDRLTDYYKDEPNVEVIVDRRGQGGLPGDHPLLQGEAAPVRQGQLPEDRAPPGA